MLRTISLGIVGLLAMSGCKKKEDGGGAAGGGGGAEYKNPDAKFKVSYPSGLTVGKVKTEGDSSNLSISNSDGSREVFLVWAKTGSSLDPEGSWSRYGHEPDHRK